MKRLGLLTLLLAAPAGAATLNITNDTYVDSYSLDGKNLTNYGSGGATKAVSNLSSTGSSGESSRTHTLFTLPAAFWAGIGNGVVTDPVTVTFSIRNNTLGRNPPASGFRQLELFPLKEAFVAGTGGNSGSTTAGARNGALVGGVATYYGADWQTTDGVTPWATVGGTFDAGVAATTTLTPITSTAQTVAAFDLTALLNNAATRAELKNFGLLLRLTDETDYTGNEFASIVSYEAGQSGSFATRGPTVSFTAVPEPATLSVLGGLVTLALARRRRA